MPDETEGLETIEETAALGTLALVEFAQRQRRRNMIATATAVTTIVVNLTLVVVVLVLLIAQTAQRAASDRNDCRSVITAARRDVLDGLSLRLDIDRTTHDQLLGNALIGSVTGTRATAEDIAAYEKNNAELTTDRALAMTLPPSLPSVDDVVDHGGDMPVLNADGAVTSTHFARCPKV